MGHFLLNLKTRCSAFFRSLRRRTGRGFHSHPLCASPSPILCSLLGQGELGKRDLTPGGQETEILWFLSAPYRPRGQLLGSWSCPASPLPPGHPRLLPLHSLRFRSPRLKLATNLGNLSLLLAWCFKTQTKAPDTMATTVWG